MIKSQLNKKDYEKIFEFINEIQNIETKFQSTILTNLLDFFGYNHLTFFLADKKGRFINPVAININPELTKTYLNYYYSTDVFHEVREHNLPFEKNVISIIDIMSYNQFENTEYYRDFLRSGNLYYEVAVPLRVKNKLIGGIGVFNPKDLGNFTPKDILILEKLSGVISNELNNYMQLNEINYKQELFKNIVSQSPIGLVVLNKSHSIIYNNNIAENFCMDILNGCSSNPIEHIIDKLFKECQLKKIEATPFLYGTISKYTFKIASSIISNSFNGIDQLIYIYITKEVEKNKKSFNRIALNYNLTNREIEVIELVAQGLSNKEISQRLFISYHTVKTHMENIFKKIEVDNRTSLIYKINNTI